MCGKKFHSDRGFDVSDENKTFDLHETWNRFLLIKLVEVVFERCSKY